MISSSEMGLALCQALPLIALAIALVFFPLCKIGATKCRSFLSSVIHENYFGSRCISEILLCMCASLPRAAPSIP
jgi:hypothetical protein